MLLTTFGNNIAIALKQNTNHNIIIIHCKYVCMLCYYSYISGAKISGVHRRPYGRGVSVLLFFEINPDITFPTNNRIAYVVITTVRNATPTITYNG